MQRKYRQISRNLQEVVQSFVYKHLRYSTFQEERLELDLNPQWATKVDLDRSSQLRVKERISFDHMVPQQSSFYNLACLLFPETSSETPLDICILDTMFFMHDNSICYIFKDARRGLLKMKQRGIPVCDAFIKRKGKRKDFHSKTLNKIKSTLTMNEDRLEKNANSNMDYFVLLKYKDNSFIRLKEPDFRSVFTNPLYANQRFRHHNCTQYIQALPSEDAEEMSIHFDWYQFKDEKLMEAANQGLLGKITSLGDKQMLKQFLLENNRTVYLYYLAFEVAAYLAIHYNKKLEKAHFHFVCEDDVWTLAGAESIQISTLTRKQYIRAELWQPLRVNFDENKNLRTPIFEEKPEERSQLYKTIDNYFQQTNEVLKNDVTNFVKKQLDRVRKTQDQKISKAIFEILHPGEGKHFYQCLNSPQRLKKTIHCAQNERKSIKPKNNQNEKSQDRNNKRPKRPKSALLQQIMTRSRNKEEFVYRGLYH